jgi:hypothetical protein
MVNIGFAALNEVDRISIEIWYKTSLVRGVLDSHQVCGVLDSYQWSMATHKIIFKLIAVTVLPNTAKIDGRQIL